MRCIRSSTSTLSGLRLDTCVGTGMTIIYSILLVRAKIISQFFRTMCLLPSAVQVKAARLSERKRLNSARRLGACWHDMRIKARAMPW